MSECLVTRCTIAHLARVFGRLEYNLIWVNMTLFRTSSHRSKITSRRCLNSCQVGGGHQNMKSLTIYPCNNEEFCERDDHK